MFRRCFRQSCRLSRSILRFDRAGLALRHVGVLRALEQLSQILTDPDSRVQLSTASRSVLEGQYYPALKALRALLPREERLLAARPA